MTDTNERLINIQAQITMVQEDVSKIKVAQAKQDVKINIIAFCAGAFVIGITGLVLNFIIK